MAGFLGRFPAQWEKHARTILAYPFDDQMWFGGLAQVRREFDELVRTIAGGEEVIVLLEENESEAIEAHVRALSPNVNVERMPLNDVWVRDSGPLFLVQGPPSAASVRLQALEFHFNAWGRKFDWDKDDRISRALVEKMGVASFQSPLVFEGGSIDFNGQGAALTTRQCLLEPNRNPGLTEAEIAAALRQLFGLQELIWLERGLEGDHTDGHVDTIARFVSADTIVCHVAESEDHPSAAFLSQNFQQLSDLATSGKSALRRVVAVPVPVKTELSWPGADVPTPFSYVNFYFSNAGLLVPQFDDANDERVLQILRDVCPNVEVIGLPAQHIMLGGGVFNCLTQQVPTVPA